ncbi:MAG: DUF177 domain-containing protein [Oscillospiraceae bacterium]|nr:DUF177 domain-containing protein [Oscillospiraceae bacterium]
MFLELESVFNTPGLSLPFDYALEGFGGLLPFAASPRVAGQVKNRAGIVTLEGGASIVLDVRCDRCAESFEYRARVPLAHTLVLSRNREDSDELILLEDTRFSPDTLAWEDIVLSLPPKMLCRPDCAGLCRRCGANLNEGPCQCRPEGGPSFHTNESSGFAGGPGWAALQELL